MQTFKPFIYFKFRLTPSFFFQLADLGKIGLSIKQAKGLVKKEFARMLD